MIGCNGADRDLTALLNEMVADELPGVFALVEVHDDGTDAWVIAWGIAFTDHVDVVALDGTLRARFRSARRARDVLSFGRHVRLVWAAPAGDHRASCPGDAWPPPATPTVADRRDGAL